MYKEPFFCSILKRSFAWPKYDDVDKNDDFVYSIPLFCGRFFFLNKIVIIDVLGGFFLNKAIQVYY